MSAKKLKFFIKTLDKPYKIRYNSSLKVKGAGVAQPVEQLPCKQ